MELLSELLSDKQERWNYELFILTESFKMSSYLINESFCRWDCVLKLELAKIFSCHSVSKEKLKSCT